MIQQNALSRAVIKIRILIFFLCVFNLMSLMIEQKEKNIITGGHTSHWHAISNHHSFVAFDCPAQAPKLGRQKSL